MAKAENDVTTRSIHSFSEQVESTRRRVETLHRRTLAATPGESSLLDEAVEELYTALEELRVSEEELHVQNDQLGEAQRELEMERRRYQDLFHLAPDPYLVTDVDGIVREANRAAPALLNVSAEILPGKPLAVYVSEDERRAFRSKLPELCTPGPVRAWETQLRPRKSAAAVPVSVHAVADPSGQEIR